MSTSRILLVALCVASLAVLLWLAWRMQRRLEIGLPPQEVCRNEADARARAGASAIAVLGTGSMAPYIPAAPPGFDPLKVTVALVTLRPAATFADIRAGDLCVYHAAWLVGSTICHQAAQHDADGWIMSGLANAHSEPSWRVTAANFVGIVGKSYVWPL